MATNPINPSQAITVEEYIAQIRRRPGMYIGSTKSRGMEQFVYELVANAIDCHLANQATTVWVSINGSMIKVADDGPGLPFDEPSVQQGISLATSLLSYPHWTRSWDDHAPHVHIDLSGFGLFVLAVLSERLTIRSWRSGVCWQQSFSRGIADSAVVIGEGHGRGTEIEVIPDPEIFGQAQPRPTVLRKTLFETVHLFAGLKVHCQEECFHASDGLQMLGDILRNPIPFYRPKNEPFYIKQYLDNLWLEVAVFEEQSPLRNFSWVNGYKTIEHGSHVNGLSQALREVGWAPKLRLIHVIMKVPEYAGPTKGKLNVPHIQETVHSALLKPLQQHLGI